MQAMLISLDDIFKEMVCDVYNTITWKESKTKREGGIYTGYHTKRKDRYVGMSLTNVQDRTDREDLDNAQ